MDNIMKLITLMISLLLISNLVNAGTTQIEFTENDTYSLEVAQINVGDTIEWLPKNKGHNVEFLAGPDMNALPPNSKLNSFGIGKFRKHSQIWQSRIFPCILSVLFCSV